MVYKESLNGEESLPSDKESTTMHRKELAINLWQ